MPNTNIETEAMRVAFEQCSPAFRHSVGCFSDAIQIPSVAKCLRIMASNYSKQGGGHE